MAFSDKDFDREGRLRFAGIDESVGTALRRVWKVLEAHLPAILARFYKRLAAEEHLAQKVGNHTGRLVQAQTEHWRRMFAGTFDDEYLESVYSIGLVHKRIGLEPRWYIAGYQFLFTELLAFLVKTFGHDHEELTITIKAVTAAVMLDVDLAIEAYHDAMEREKLDQVSRVAQQIAVNLKQGIDEVNEIVSSQVLSLPGQIKRALHQQEFFLQYQPIVDLRTGRCVGAEALLRWRTTDGLSIAPDHFIPVAEAKGLIRDVTDYVIRRAIDETSQLMRENPDFALTVNVSKDDMESMETVDLVQKLCAETGLAPERLCIEATERGFVQLEKAMPVLEKLRSLGFIVAIDDFGTGYSSLASLQSLPLTHLKIDKAFVDTIQSDGVVGNVVHHIIEMATALRLRTIAEGIENGFQLAVLRAHGVALGQGWLFSKPLPIIELQLFVGSYQMNI